MMCCVPCRSITTQACCLVSPVGASPLMHAVLWALQEHHHSCMLCCGPCWSITTQACCVVSPCRTHSPVSCSQRYKPPQHALSSVMCTETQASSARTLQCHVHRDTSLLSALQCHVHRDTSLLSKHEPRIIIPRHEDEGSAVP